MPQTYMAFSNPDETRKWKVPLAVRSLQRAQKENPAAKLSPELPNTTLRSSLNPYRFGGGDLWNSDRDTNPQSPFFQPSREQLINAARKLYDIDPRNNGIIDTIVGDLTYTTPHWVPNIALGNTEKDWVRNITMEVDNELGLSDTLDEWLRQFFIDGDLFLQLVFRKNRQHKLVQVSPMSTLHTIRNSTGADKFKDLDKAFIFNEGSPFGGMFMPTGELGDGDRYFADMEVVHARWNRLLTSRYGNPMLKATFKTAEKLLQGEADTSVRRNSRAPQRYKHKFDTKYPEEVLRRYKLEMMAQSLDVNAKVQDMFLQPGIDVETLEGEADIGGVEDLEFLSHGLYSASPVPMSFMSYNNNINRDVMHALYPRYLQKLERISRWVSINILEPIMYRAMMANSSYLSRFSIPVGKELVRVKFGNRNVYDSQNAGQAVKAVAEGMEKKVLTKAAVVDILEYEMPFVDWERVRKEMGITNQLENQDPLNGSATTIVEESGEGMPIADNDADWVADLYNRLVENDF